MGLNEVLGYVACFDANYFCRWCKTLKAITHTDCQERDENLISVASYKNDILLVQEKTGIVEFSIWNEVADFHVYENCLADVLHDGPEGAFAYDMEHVTYHVVKKADKKVDLKVLNDRILNFDYRKHEFSNRPPPIFEIEMKNKDLKVSASEMMAYIYSFQCLLVIWGYHEMYVRLFQDSLKPKHHHMVHYGRVLRISGLIYLLSAFKFESNDRVMKTRAEATCSRKNITFNLALKEQIQFAYRSVIFSYFVVRKSCKIKHKSKKYTNMYG